MNISRQYDVAFTFFLNMGRSISVINSLKDIFLDKKSKSYEAEPQMMSAMQKLGKADYMIAALINPKISSYKLQIKELLESECEIGLHGGRNHAAWGGTL